jgi:hypothetical protein
MNNIHIKMGFSNRQKGLLSVTIIVISSLLLLIGLYLSDPIQKTFAQQPPCNLSKVQPLDPVDMNTIAFKTLTKTIHVEKELYDNCKGVVPSVLDVSIFTELKENLTNFPKIVSNVSFELVTCGKTSTSGSPAGCQQGIPITNPMPRATECKQVNIAFPIEMNTVNTDNGIIKTVESEKESFQCRVSGNVPTGFGPLGMKDVVTFTEILEDAGSGTIVKMSQATTCMKPVTPTTSINSKNVICQASKASVIPS